MRYRVKLRKYVARTVALSFLMILGGCTIPKLSQAVVTVEPRNISPGDSNEDNPKALYSSASVGVETSESPVRAPGLCG